MITGLPMLAALRWMSVQIQTISHHHLHFVDPILNVTIQKQVITAHVNWDTKIGKRTQVIIFMNQR